MVTTITPHYEEYLWTFDLTYQDVSSTFNGTPINGPQFSPLSINGYGSSISFSSAAQQSVVTSTPFLSLNNRSWTFEAWIYLQTIPNNSNYYGIVGQCQSQSLDICFHLIIYEEKLYFGFFADDISGQTSLLASKWYHVAFVFDNVSRSQSIYLNGILDGNRTADSVYLGSSGDLTFGTCLPGSGACFFDGLIDQLSFIGRVKTSAEILDGATLTLHFSFDNGSLYDSGPLRLDGSLFGTTSVVTGRVGDALQFGVSLDSYFRVGGLVLLGISNQSYSMSIWMKPNVIDNSTIIHVSSRSNGSGWCLEMLGLRSSGQLIARSYSGTLVSVTGPILSANSWTHVAMTYNRSNGLRLYVNGTLYNSSIPFAYYGSGSPNYLFLGSSLNMTFCSGASGQYVGILDEFRVYSRELTAYDVYTLSHS